MLLWFKDLTNVTEEVTIHRLKVSNWCHAPNFNIYGKKKYINKLLFCILKKPPFSPPPPPTPRFTTHTTVWLGEHGHNPIYFKSDHRVTMRNEVSLVFHIFKE